MVSLRQYDWLLIIFNETHKGLLLRWSYKFDLFSQIFFYAFMFVGFTFFQGDASRNTDKIASALLGYLLWFYLMHIGGSMGSQLREEAQTGTLEQMYMSPAPSGLVQIGRSLSPLLIATPLGIVIAAPLVLLYRLNIPWVWGAAPIFLLTILEVYGYAFVVGGATLLFKNVDNLAALFRILLLFLNGAFRPIDEMPAWLASLARALPTTQGVVVLRQVVLEGRSLASVWTDGSLVWLTLHAIIYFVLGWGVYAICERQARKEGLLGQY
jgi:ABC-2 type transport system permease protein